MNEEKKSGRFIYTTEESFIKTNSQYALKDNNLHNVFDSNVQSSNESLRNSTFEDIYFNDELTKKSYNIFVLSNSFRKLCIKIMMNKIFNIFIYIIIIINSITIYFEFNQNFQLFNFITNMFFLIIFILEFFIKSVSLGFIIGENTYLTDPWNWLDFIILISGFIDIVTGFKLKTLKIFSLFRIFKVIKIFPNIRRFLLTFIESLIQLTSVYFLFFISIIIFSIIGLTLFKGRFHYLCRLEEEPINGKLEINDLFADTLCGGYNSCNNHKNLCLSMKSFQDKKTYFILKNLNNEISNEFFNYGITTFDNIFKSFLIVFITSTGTGWSQFMKLIMDGYNYYTSFIYFSMCIIVNNFFMLKLIIAVLLYNFQQNQEREKTINRKEIGYLINKKSNISLKKHLVKVNKKKKYYKKYNLIKFRNISNSKHFQKFISFISKNNYCNCFLKIEKHSQYHKKYKFAYYCFFIMNQPFLQFIFSLLIIFNSIILAIQIENLSNNTQKIFSILNIIVIYIFCVEKLLFLIGEGLLFFKSKLNIFDLIIVITSFIEINIKIKNKNNYIYSLISSIRIFQLLKYLNVFPMWKKVNIIASSMIFTAWGILDFVFFFIIIIYIFSLMGHLLFQDSMKIDSNGNYRGENESYAFHFDDIVNSILSTFMIIIGEHWENLFYQCYKSPLNSKNVTSIYFFILILFGRFAIMNTFTAYLIDSFEYSYNISKKNNIVKNNLLFLNLGITREYQREMMQKKNIENINQLFRNYIWTYKKRRIASKGHLILVGKSIVNMKINNARIYDDYLYFHLKKKYTNKKEINLNQIKKDKYYNKLLDNVKFYKFNIDYNKIYIPERRRKYLLNKEEEIIESRIDNVFRQPLMYIEPKSQKKKENKKQKKEKTNEKIEESSLNKIIDYCKNSSLFIFHKDSAFRKNIKLMVNSNEFNNIIYILILINTVIICIDNEWIIPNSSQEYLVKGGTIFLNVLFFIEGIFRIISDGFIINPKPDINLNLKGNSTFEETMYQLEKNNTKNINYGQMNDVDKKEIIKKAVIQINNQKAYLRNIKNLIDFICILIGIIDLSGKIKSKKFLRILRSIRTFKIIRLITNSRKMSLMIRTVIECFPALGLLVIIIIIDLYIYSIFSMNLFKNQLTYYCDDLISKDKETCINNEGKWIYNHENYQNFLFSFKTNFEILSGINWAKMMDFAWNITQNKFTFLYFISSVILSHLYILNIVISFLSQKFRELKNKEDDYIDLSNEEIEWIKLQKFIMKYKPYKDSIEETKCKKKVQELIKLKKFQFFITLCIIIAIIILMCQYDSQSLTFYIIFEIINILLTIIFNIEIILKLIVDKYHFFQNSWNVYDFVIVIICDIIVIVNIFSYFGVFNYNSVSTLPIIFRIFETLKSLRILSSLYIIRNLINSFVIILPNIANVTLIIVFVMIIYANIGMNCFGTVPFRYRISRTSNFKGFIPSIIILFKVTTGEYWNEIMNELAYHDCRDSSSDIYKQDYYCINYNIICYDTFYADHDKIYDIEQSPSSFDVDYDIYQNSQIYHFTCGTNFSYFYFISYILICPILLMNLCIMLIVEGFNESVIENNLIINEEYVKQFIDIWMEYDTFGSLKVLPHEFVLIFKQLKPPFGLLYDRDIFFNPLKFERIRHQYTIFNRYLFSENAKINEDINFNEKNFGKINSNLPFGYQFSNFYLSKNKKFFTNDLEVSRILNLLNLTAFNYKYEFPNKNSFTFSNEILYQDEEEPLKKNQKIYIHYVDACLALTKYAVAKSKNIDINILRDKKVIPYTMNYWIEKFDFKNINTIFYSKDNYYGDELKMSKVFADESLNRIKKIVRKKIENNPNVIRSIWKNKLIRIKSIIEELPFLKDFKIINKKNKKIKKKLYYRSTIRGTLILIPSNCNFKKK